jgi:N-acetyl-gamma-glutamyl-phosphate reductase
MLSETLAALAPDTSKGDRVRVAVGGATGYAGQELIKLLARHPVANLVMAMSSGADNKPRPMPALARVWDGTAEPLDVARLAEAAEVVFLALPEAVSAEVAPRLLEQGVRVIDLSGAFRISDDAARQQWYPDTGTLPTGVAYGLSEHNAVAIRDARLIANPGCYPTAALLALKPLWTAGLIDDPIIIDAKSGASGAGKKPSERTHFCEVHGSVSAYGVFSHRHSAEIDQGLGTDVTFVPHLVPLDRGILESIYTPLRAGVNEAAVAAAYADAYRMAPFVRLAGGALPQIQHVAHTNFCDIGWKVDEPRQRLVVFSVIDNLVKGAAGQAVQNLNIVLGLDERTGLL